MKLNVFYMFTIEKYVHLKRSYSMNLEKMNRIKAKKKVHKNSRNWSYAKNNSSYTHGICLCSRKNIAATNKMIACKV